MTKTIQVTMVKSSPLGTDKYQIVKMKNAVILAGYGAGKAVYGVGSRLTEKEARELSAFRNIEVVIK